MAQTIKLKRSASQGAVPSISDLDLGEVAINTYDGKMYIKKDDGTSPETIVEVTGSTNTTYSIAASAGSPGGALFDLTAGGSGSGTDSILFVGSGATTVTRTDADTITISSTDTNTDTNTTYSISASAGSPGGALFDLTAGGSGSGTDSILFVGSGATTVTRTDADTITVDTAAPTFGGTTVNGAGTYGSTANGTKIDNITIDEYGRITEIATGATGSMSSFNIQADGGTQVGISNGEEVNFIAGTNTSVAIVNQTNPTVQINVADSPSFAGAVTVSTDTEPQILVKPNSDSSQDATIEIRAARNSPSQGVEVASLKLSTYDSNDSPPVVKDLALITSEAVVGADTTLNSQKLSFQHRVSGALSEGMYLYNNDLIVPNGNVGIGTTSPLDVLEISKQLSAVSAVDFPLVVSSRDDGNSLNQLGGEGVGIKFRLANNDSTTPGGSFVGAGIAAIREDATDANSTTSLAFYTSQNDETLDRYMTIDSSGNVGIGTASPDADLQIGDFTGSRRLLLAGANTTSDSSQIIFADSSGQPSPFYAGMGIRYNSDTNKLIIESHFDAGVSPNATTQSILTLDREDQSATFAADVIVQGDLFVTGASTAVNVEDLNVEQGEITLNYSATADTSASADGSGIRIQDAVDASNDATILWDATDDEFTFSHPIEINRTTAGGQLLHVKNSHDGGYRNDLLLENTNDRDVGIAFKTAGGDYEIWMDSNGDDSLIFAPGSGTSDIALELYQNKNADFGGNITTSGWMSFGVPGAGANTTGRFLSIEGNADSSGEGSGRIFFSEHNSTTGSMSNYGMSLGYRGGGTSIVGADGNTWTGLAAIGNGQWGMWGHDNNATGALIMSGDRAATVVEVYTDLTVENRIYGQLRLADISTSSPTDQSLFGIYAWDTQLQFNARNISTDAYIANILTLDYSTYAADFSGDVELTTNGKAVKVNNTPGTWSMYTDTAGDLIFDFA